MSGDEKGEKDAGKEKEKSLHWTILRVAKIRKIIL
jgi:hypothetical protein